jgi:hypothetical protein
MPRVGFQPMIPVFERAKTVHAIDRAATVISTTPAYFLLNCTVAMLVMLMVRSQGRNNENELYTCRHLNMATFHIYVCSSIVNFLKHKQHTYTFHHYYTHTHAYVVDPGNRKIEEREHTQCILTLHIRF